jgi:pectinesterase inhibitor-like protein
MAIKHYTSFSLVFLATTTVLLVGRTHGHGLRTGKHDICQKADFKPLCRTVVKGLTDPRVALRSAIHQLIIQSRRAIRLADLHGKSDQYMDVCKESFDDALTSLRTSLKNLKNHDRASLNINLSAALSDYVTCDDAFSESGMGNPLGKIDALMSRMASNCLYLSSLVH